MSKKVFLMMIGVFCVLWVNADNLIVNGGFEEGDKGWRAVKKDSPVTIDSSCAFSGQNSLRLKCIDDRAWSGLKDEIALEPNIDYELSFYVKGENIGDPSGKIKGPGAFMIIGHDKKLLRVTTIQRQNELGTFDWKKGSIKLNSSFFNSKTMKISVGIIGSGTVWYDDFKLRKIGETAWFRQSFIPTLKSVALYPEGGTRGFFDPEQPVTMKLEFETETPVHYSCTIKDHAGKVVWTLDKKQTKMISPGKRDIIMTIPGQKNGYYVADVDIYVKDQIGYHIQSAFTVNNAITKRDPFFNINPFGMNPEMLDGYSRMGAGSIQVPVPFRKHFLHGDAEGFGERFVKRYQEVINSDFVLNAMVSASLWRNDQTEERLRKGWPFMTETQLQIIEKVVTGVAKNTKGRIKNWSIICEISSKAHNKDVFCGTWSEGMSDFLVMARVISRIVKKIDPEIKVSAGGNCSMNEQAFIAEKIVMGDLRDDFDIYDIDGYAGNWDMTRGPAGIPENNLEKFYQMSSDIAFSLGKPKEIQNCENGYSILYGSRFDEIGLAREQASLTARTIIISKGMGFVTMYSNHKPYTRPAKNIQDKDRYMATVWKSVTADTADPKKWHSVPLPAGAAYATAARQLAFVENPVKIASPDGETYCYVFKKPSGDTLITLWNFKKTLDVKLDLPAKAELVNMYGAEQSLNPGENNLKVDREPVYITTQIPYAEAVKLMVKVVNTNSIAFRAAGKRISSSQVQIYVRNLLNDQQKIQLSVPGQKTVHETVKPGMNTFTLPCAADATGNGMLVTQSGKTYPIILDLSYLKVKYLASKPVFDGSGHWTKNLSSGILKYPEDILPELALHPEMRYFKNAHNPNGHSVSAEYFTGYDNDYFYLAVNVDDPTHIQRYTGNSMWKDDSIQFAFYPGTIVPAELRIPQTSSRKFASSINFGLGLTKNGTELIRYLGDKRGMRNYPAKVTRKNGKTFYEAAIPWEEIGGRTGTEIRFGMVIFDNNNMTNPKAPYWLYLTRGVAGGNDASYYRLISFE